MPSKRQFADGRPRLRFIRCLQSPWNGFGWRPLHRYVVKIMSHLRTWSILIIWILFFFQLIAEIRRMGCGTCLTMHMWRGSRRRRLLPQQLTSCFTRGEVYRRLQAPVKHPAVAPVRTTGRSVFHAIRATGHLLNSPSPVRGKIESPKREWQIAGLHRFFIGIFQ